MSAEAATEKILRDNSIQILDDKLKNSAEKLDSIQTNQAALITQQTILRTAQSAISDELKDLKEKFSTSQISEIINEIMILRGSPVFFNAHSPSDYGTSNTAIVFSTVIEDSNSGLDPKTGKVHIKTRGLYHFSFSLTTSIRSKTGILAYLMQNNKELCGGYSSDSSNNQTVGCSATFTANENDEIYVYLSRGQIISGSQSSFTGFLVHKN